MTYGLKKLRNIQEEVIKGEVANMSMSSALTPPNNVIEDGNVNFEEPSYLLAEEGLMSTFTKTRKQLARNDGEQI